MFLKSVESHWDKFETVLDGVSVEVTGTYVPEDREVGACHGFDVLRVYDLEARKLIETSQEQDEALEQEYLDSL